MKNIKSKPTNKDIKVKDEKFIWYNKGWDACIREFEWRIKFLEEDKNYYLVLEVIDKLKK